MQSFRCFDILGPRMTGPSSSHTAGAARLAHVAWQLSGRDVAAVALTLYGSFAKTGRGHGTDKALLAGVLGLNPDDERLRYSYLLAQEAGLSYSFSFEEESPDDYANMARIVITGHDAHVTDVLGASIGGGNILITGINGMQVQITGEYPTLIISHNDTPGMIGRVTSFLALYGYNIAGMRVYRDGRGLKAYMALEMDSAIDASLLEALSHMENVNRLCMVDKV